MQPPEYGTPNYPPPPAQGGNNVVKVLLFLVIALVLCLCLIPFCVIIVLALLGPSVGNVFSDIIQTLEATPSPSMLWHLVWF